MEQKNSDAYQNEDAASVSSLREALAKIGTNTGALFDLSSAIDAARAALSGVTDNDRHHYENDNERLREIEAAARAYMNAVEREVIPEGDMLTTTTWHRLTDALSGVTQPAKPTRIEMTEAQIKHMVDRFLSWKLPESFNPDGGISFEKTFNEHTSYPSKHEPYGTNLFNFDEATAMVRHMLEGLPATEVDADQDLDPRTPKFGVAP